MKSFRKEPIPGPRPPPLPGPARTVRAWIAATLGISFMLLAIAASLLVRAQPSGPRPGLVVAIGLGGLLLSAASWRAWSAVRERDRNEATLSEAMEDFRTFFDESPIGKSMTGPDGRLRRVNRAFCSMLGYSAEELASLDFTAITHPDDVSRSREALRSLLDGERPSWTTEKRYVRKDGSSVWADVTTSLRRDDRGRPVCFLTHVRDVTERRRLEVETDAVRTERLRLLEEADKSRRALLSLVEDQARTEAQLRRSEAKYRQLSEELERRVLERTAELESSNLELEAFSYSVSHDLRAPLRAIEGFSALVVEQRTSQVDAETQRRLGIVRTNARRMAQLIDDLLLFSRTGRSEIRRGRLDMGAMARSAFEEVVPDPEARAKICFRVGGLPEADGDAALLRQVWVNLISNAVKFSSARENPLVEVEGARDGDHAVYRVKDNGAGFDMAYVAKLFGVFQRLHGMNEFEGTGVGLALVKRIVTRHGGRIWAEGAIGQGATLSFSLPCAGRSSG